MTPNERGDLAERLLPKALDFAGLVHGDGDTEDIARFLRTLRPVERDWFPVILAALVDVDRTEADMLRWITWDEHGQAAGRKPCGTYPAYRSHLERGELVDDACAEAGRAYYRERYRRRAKTRKAKDAATREEKAA